MTSRPWEDDDAFLVELGEVVRSVGRVPDSVRETGRAAFNCRTVDPQLVLASVSYDSCLDDGLYLRGEGSTGPRIVAFQAESLCVEIELTDEQVVGQLVPPSAGEVSMMTIDGIAGQATADAMGCFGLPLPSPGPVRFRCRTPASAVLTDWVHL